METWVIILISCFLARGAWGLNWTSPASGGAVAGMVIPENTTTAVTLEKLDTTSASGAVTYAIMSVDGDMTTANWKFELASYVLRCKAFQSFDYETKKKYVVVVTATDSATTITGTVTVQLSDVDDNTSTFPTSCGYAALDSIFGDVVGNYAVCDDDVADTISYHLTNGNAGGYFKLDSGTGIITKSDSAFPSNATTSYSLVIEARGSVNTATTTVSVVLGQTCTCPGSGSSGSSGLSFEIFTIFAAIILQEI